MKIGRQGFQPVASHKGDNVDTDAERAALLGVLETGAESWESPARPERRSLGPGTQGLDLVREALRMCRGAYLDDDWVGLRKFALLSASADDGDGFPDQSSMISRMFQLRRRNVDE